MDSLNTDPYNLRAEELALEDCAQGVEIRRTWCEKEMVRSFDGRHFPGTPDGMYETWDGALTCVQVVRVPLVRELSLDAMHEILAYTMLTKVVKSQQWLRASHFEPQDFVIFCWLPFSVEVEVEERAAALMMQVRDLDPRFSLRLRVPAEAGSLFPALFASNFEFRDRKARGYSWSDVSTYTGADESDEEDEEVAWDITWDWDEEEEGCDTPTSSGTKQDNEEEWEFEWDITWGWEQDMAAAVASDEATAMPVDVQVQGSQLVDSKVECHSNQDENNSGQMWSTYIFDDGG